MTPYVTSLMKVFFLIYKQKPILLYLANSLNTYQTVISLYAIAIGKAKPDAF